MNYPLWKFFFDDDVDSFRQFLARATFDRSASKPASGAHNAYLKVGSPSNLATSPKSHPKTKKSGGNIPVTASRGPVVILTRADINVRDDFGRTLLHHAASSHLKTAIEFVKLLIEVPFIDLYVQDVESGWTALHRALYFGNIAIAQALMLKDIQNATDYTTNVSHTNAGGLVKIKDHEGNSPFEVFGLTTAPRDLQQHHNVTLEAAETASVQSEEIEDLLRGAERSRHNITGPIDLYGDEVFAFGSNKNITLGLGDGDNRQFPERVYLARPDHLLERFSDDLRTQRRKEALNEESTNILADPQDNTLLPAIIQYKPIVIQDVIMSKLHTAILTRDPISNLHICGFGPGGRLGTGDEATRFSYVCIQGGGLAKRRVASIALGQDHSVAVCSSGEVFTWGSNKYGQLGYELPDVPAKDTPLQLTPRQLYGLIKKEQIIGAAASSMHSVIYTSSGLYTFGKNEGQLGLMDADARSLEIQVIPRRVGVSILQYPIQSVSAIDRATTVLLENHEVIVFTNYAWTKVMFPLDGFGSDYVSNDFFSRHNRQTKHISKITSGGNTICAMTSYGEVFTIDVPARLESVPSSKSTTNPSKAKNALPTPSKVWSIRKSHMAASDAAVGQDGSVLLCTSSGTVWRKEKRANIKTVHSNGVSTLAKPKDYKFVRVPNIFGAVAVRSNAHGAFYAIRKDSNVMKDQIVVEASGLWDVLFDLLPFKDYKHAVENEDSVEPELRFWKPATKGSSPAFIKRCLLLNQKAEEDFLQLSRHYEPLSASDFDTWITSNATDVRIPVHSFVMKARSRTLRAALSTFSETYYFSIPDVLSVEYGPDGQVCMQLNGADFLTMINLVLYMYTDQVLDVWRYTSKFVYLAPRYRQVRIEVMRLANALDLKQLEKAVRIMDDPAASMREDFEVAFHDSDLFSDADIIIDLAEGEERYAHSVILRSRCPFFEGFFNGHTGGMWMANRIRDNEEGQSIVHIDLTHIDTNVFELVLRHIYADTSEELFDSIIAKDLDEFLDFVIEVMAVANELMLDRLARVCQKVVGCYVTPRNVCGLLNTIAESSEVDFKQAALEYIGLDVENMLEHGLLEELDRYLLEELDETVQANQRAFMPFARSDRALEVLLEHNLDLAARMEDCRQRRLDWMRLPSRYVTESVQPLTRSKSSNSETFKAQVASSTTKALLKDDNASSTLGSPTILTQDAREEMPFEMDEDRSIKSASNFHLGVPALQTGSDGHSSKVLSHRNISPRSSGLLTEHDDGDNDFSSLSSTLQIHKPPNMPHSPLDTAGTAKAAWATPTMKTPTVGLKDIMQEDSSVKVSSLTQSLKHAGISSSSGHTRVSQKERKRQQQRTKIEVEAPEASNLSQVEGMYKVQPMNEPPTVKSPWQKVTKASTPLSPPVRARSDVSRPSELSSSSPLNTSDEAKKTGTNQDRAKDAPRPARSTSTPGMSGLSHNPPPQIQSIRHTPAPMRSPSWVDARTPLADILAQQQFEKTAIKETAAKRALHDIQQEQEFQEWWDNESRRVQEEEAAANLATTRKSRGGRGRGGNRRKSSDRGVKPSSERAESSKDGITDERSRHEDIHGKSTEGRKAEQGKARGRGSGRGRGRSVSNKT